MSKYTYNFLYESDWRSGNTVRLIDSDSDIDDYHDCGFVISIEDIEAAKKDILIYICHVFDVEHDIYSCGEFKVDDINNILEEIYCKYNDSGSFVVTGYTGSYKEKGHYGKNKTLRDGVNCPDIKLDDNDDLLFSFCVDTKGTIIEYKYLIQ